MGSLHNFWKKKTSWNKSVEFQLRWHRGKPNKKLHHWFPIWSGNDHEFKFHEIKIQLFHEIKIMITRSKFYLFMRSKFTIIFSQFWSGGWHFVHEIETQTSIITNFDLMIILAANKSIMRSKLKKALLGNFDLMIDLLAASAIMRSNRWLIIRAKNEPQVQLTKFK